MYSWGGSQGSCGSKQSTIRKNGSPLLAVSKNCEAMLNTRGANQSSSVSRFAVLARYWRTLSTMLSELPGSTIFSTCSCGTLTVGR
jgi:hypothetical protein